MCGIVGYIGKREVTPILVNGLKRLEYRGYDSAGVVVIDKKGSGHLERRVGKVAMLEKAMAENDWGSASIGIAHTRWATHGPPSEGNAHPQSDCTNAFWVAHNGIVENYKELKDALIVNPYDIGQAAKAIKIAIQMPIPEQTDRMRRMRSILKDQNIYRWASELVKELIQVRLE